MGEQTEIRHAIGRDGTLELRTVSGRVRLNGGDGEEAVVTARADSSVLRELAVDRGHGRLMVQPDRLGVGLLRRQSFGIDFDVSLPRGARVDIKGVSADVSARDLTGEQEYKTVSGDLHLANTGGRLTLQTVSGDVRLEGGHRLELGAMTTSGDVQVEAEQIDYLRVRTVSGDVRLATRLGDGPRHVVETVSGDLTLRSAGGVTVERSRAIDIGRSGRQPIVIGDGSASLSFRSMSGDARVSGPTTGAAASMAAGPTSEATQPPSAATAASAAPAADRLDVLRALERGEIDVDEAARRLEEVATNA
jgi:DUF4097 and DUF4098 domain-containing protein YvlB